MTARPTEKQPAAEWVYRGIWKVLSDCFHVPETPPNLPSGPDEEVVAFHPSRDYLRLLKLEFWILCVLIDLAILAGWIVLTVFVPWLGVLLAVPALLIAVVPDIFAYIAVHLRYDCTWYVMSPRSLRVRRGIWIITEQTITFENVQNVNVSRGPIQQLFGIATLKVSTAGAGHSSGEGHSTGNTAILDGIDNPAELRTRIMDRVRASRSAGLGDDDERSVAGSSGAFSPEHVAVLREIREEISALV